jgi:hypothetical protein
LQRIWIKPEIRKEKKRNQKRKRAVGERSSPAPNPAQSPASQNPKGYALVSFRCWQVDPTCQVIFYLWAEPWASTASLPSVRSRPLAKPYPLRQVAAAYISPSSPSLISLCSLPKASSDHGKISRRNPRRLWARPAEFAATSEP